MDTDLQKPVRERPDKKDFGQGQDKRHMNKTGVGVGVGVGDTGQKQPGQGQKPEDSLIPSSSSLQPSQITNWTKHHQPVFTQLAGIRADDPVGVYNPDMDEKMKPKPYLIR